MSPTEIQDFLAKLRAKQKTRKFSGGHIDRRTDQPHYPRNRVEAGTLLHLAIAANDLDALRFYVAEVTDMLGATS
jgi:SHS2 domain-containing protein